MVCACKRCRTIVDGKTAKAAVAHHFNHLIDSRQLFQIDGLSLVRFVRSFVYSIFRSVDVVHFFVPSLLFSRNRSLYTRWAETAEIYSLRIHVSKTFTRFFSASTLTLQRLWFCFGCTMIWSLFGYVQCAGARGRRRIEAKSIFVVDMLTL